MRWMRQIELDHDDILTVCDYCQHSIPGSTTYWATEDGDIMCEPCGDKREADALLAYDASKE